MYISNNIVLDKSASIPTLRCIKRYIYNHI